jgi:hypothetical protein
MMPAFLRWNFGLAITFLLLGVPIVDYRWEYTHGKRLREVEPGRLYRSGQMTASGFEEAVARYHLRTIINLQDEYPDPQIYKGYFTARTIRETELCRRLGVRYFYIVPDLISRRLVPARRPEAIDRFLAIMDDPANYPVLIHCRAGLHRTGVMTAVYRMEYDRWGVDESIRELKANGFGEWPCSSANDYIMQYILTYRPGVRGAITVAHNEPH